MNDTIDLEAFQSKVNLELIDLTSATFHTKEPEEPSRERKRLEALKDILVKDLVSISPDHSTEKYDISNSDGVETIEMIVEVELRSDLRQVSAEKAKEIIKRRDIRHYLCPALKSVSDDSFEIAKIITPLLIGLAAANTITIPLVPILFASIALAVARMSISSLCVDYPKKDETKK